MSKKTHDDKSGLHALKNNFQQYALSGGIILLVLIFIGSIILSKNDSTPVPTSVPSTNIASVPDVLPLSTDDNTIELAYVLNTHTKKFHSPNCGEVKKIKESNRCDITATKENILDSGYAPCGKCNP
ncbi:MAG: hypothetical protein IJ766_04305 [Clostridia bacterium]|nr:hypothetical protein [Clostridia bacterium]